MKIQVSLTQAGRVDPIILSCSRQDPLTVTRLANTVTIQVVVKASPTHFYYYEQMKLTLHQITNSHSTDYCYRPFESSQV